MTSMLVCDHCHRELESDDAIKVGIDLSLGALKAWLKAEHIDPPVIRVDLHLECYAETLGPAVDVMLAARKGTTS